MSQADAFYDKFENELMPRLANLAALNGSAHGLGSGGKVVQDFDSPKHAPGQTPQAIPHTMSDPISNLSPRPRRSSAPISLAHKEPEKVHSFSPMFARKVPTVPTPPATSSGVAARATARSAAKANPPSPSADVGNSSTEAVHPVLRGLTNETFL